MGDVAQILKNTQAPGAGSSPSKAMKISGISKEVMTLLGGKQDPNSAALPPIMPSLVKEQQQQPAKGTDGDTDINSSGNNEIKVKVGNKLISSSKPARPWTWAPFASSSRTDGALFRHWVRANVEYTDYPYAKFDIHLDPIVYTDDEYANHLKNEGWTKSETDKLMELVRKYELRWAVIHDRWLQVFASQEGRSSPDMANRKVEDLQERYYTVAAILAQIRITQEAKNELQTLESTKPDPENPEKTDQILLETAAARAIATAPSAAQPLMTNLGTGTTNKIFDAAKERERRSQLDRMWRRSKEEEQEELELRKELRAIETQLRKLKKSGGHIVAAAASGNGRLPSAAASRNASRSVTPVPGTALVDNPDLLHQNFALNAPVPMAETPYLQSGRLVPPATGGSAGLNKTMLTRMQQILTELKVPAKPLPTKRVCDVYDSVRKDAVVLMTLQKMVLQTEGALHAKRVKLHKLGGGDGKILDEEELLGIAPPPTPPAPAPAPLAAASASTKKALPKPSTTSGGGTTSNKPKSTSGTMKSKSAAKPKTSSDGASKSTADKKDATKDASKDATAKKKSSAKRKRKPDAKDGKEAKKKPATAAAVPSSGNTAPSTTAAGPAGTKTTIAKATAPTPASGKTASTPAAVPSVAAPAAAAAPTSAAKAAMTPKSTTKTPSPAADGSSGSPGKRSRKP